VTKRLFLFFHRETTGLNCKRGKLLGRVSFIVIIFSITSCVSAKYKMASEDSSPPVPLNLSAEAHSVNARIDTVIIYGGPGSWKREAYWDEYLLTITNLSEHPTDLIASTLIDFQGNPVMSGDKPWELQEQSKEWIEHYDSGTTGVVLKVGAASVMVGAIVGGLALASGSSAFFSAAALASAAAPVAALVALPLVGIGTVLVNVDAKRKVEAEFNHRRLVLPTTIQPGQTTRGSLFFRITPGPYRMTLLFRGVDPEFNVTVDLTPLSDLHIDTMPEPKQIEPNRTSEDKL
jgi:hypothetical protein